MRGAAGGGWTQARAPKGTCQCLGSGCKLEQPHSAAAQDADGDVHGKRLAQQHRPQLPARCRQWRVRLASSSCSVHCGPAAAGTACLRTTSAAPAPLTAWQRLLTCPRLGLGLLLRVTTRRGLAAGASAWRNQSQKSCNERLRVEQQRVRAILPSFLHHVTQLPVWL
jgi:hypothetical protein